MTFKLYASLKFATAAARDTAITTINNMAVPRSLPPAVNKSVYGFFALGYEAESSDTGAVGIVWATIQGLSTPLVAVSYADHHTCRHDEGTPVCITTASKRW